jgi:cell division protein FtsN
MVRFSDIIKTDSKSIRKILAPERDLPVEEPVETGGKAEETTETQVPVDLLPADTGSESVRTRYRQLLDQAIDLRDRVIKNKEIRPSPVIAIFRNIIDDDLIGELFDYANSVPDDLGLPSQIISVTLAHLKAGKKMGYDSNKLLKTGFAALLHSVDINELPDRILQEDVLSPDDIDAIRKHPGLTFDMLAHLVATPWDATPANTQDIEGGGDRNLLLHVNDTGPEQEAIDKMGEPENAYKELAEIATEKKSGSAKLLFGLILLALIVVSALWLSGILPFDKTEETTQVASKEHKPILHNETISQPIKEPKPELAPAKETTQRPDEETDLETDKSTLPEETPARSTEKPKTIPVTIKPVPSSPHEAIKSSPDLSPAVTVSNPYSLHMGSFKNLELTAKSLEALKEKGLSPYWTRVDLGKKGEWFRVFVGSFTTADKAQAFQEKHGITADRILKTAYAVQIGMYTSKEELDEKISILKKTGHCPYYIEQPQNRYQLLIGAYQTRKAAEEFTARLKKSGLDCEMILR